MSVKMIAAVDKDYGLGFKGKMPWKIPEEMAYFKQTTMGGVVIMGRKTFDSLKKPLVGRVNYVISRQEHSFKVGDLQQTIDHAKVHHPDKTIWIIGGAQLYEEAFPYSDEIWLSHLPNTYETDVRFPSMNGWSSLDSMTRLFERNGQLLFTRKVYRRQKL